MELGSAAANLSRRRFVMRVGVLGSGVVAQVLAAGFVKHGHEVTIGSRDPEKLVGWNEQNPKAQRGTFAEAAAFGELIVLAVKGGVASEALGLAGAQNLDGKTVIDACNPIADAPPVNGVLQFFTGPNESLMEQLQSEFADVHFVKAFNSVGNMQMIDPVYAEGRPTMFICGNSDGAKKSVATILDQFGWETADMGGVEAARAIEPLCMLWCIPGFVRNEWTHAFKLLKK
jgi:predicted dinucleotide-binding enzyme